MNMVLIQLVHTMAILISNWRESMFILTRRPVRIFRTKDLKTHINYCNIPNYEHVDSN